MECHSKRAPSGCRELLESILKYTYGFRIYKEHYGKISIDEFERLWDEEGELGALPKKTSPVTHGYIPVCKVCGGTMTCQSSGWVCMKDGYSINGNCDMHINKGALREYNGAVRQEFIDPKTGAILEQSELKEYGLISLFFDKSKEEQLHSTIKRLYRDKLNDLYANNVKVMEYAIELYIKMVENETDMPNTTKRLAILVWLLWFASRYIKKSDVHSFEKLLLQFRLTPRDVNGVHFKVVEFLKAQGLDELADNKPAQKHSPGGYWERNLSSDAKQLIRTLGLSLLQQKVVERRLGYLESDVAPERLSRFSLRTKLGYVLFINKTQEKDALMEYIKLHNVKDDLKRLVAYMKSAQAVTYMRKMDEL